MSNERKAENRMTQNRVSLTFVSIVNNINAGYSAKVSCLAVSTHNTYIHTT